MFAFGVFHSLQARYSAAFRRGPFRCATALPVLLLLTATFPACPQEREPPLFSLRLVPNAALPIGDSSALFGPAGGSNLVAELRLPFLSFLSLEAGIGYSLYSLKDATDLQESLSLFTAGGGFGLLLPLLPWFGVQGFVQGGYGYGFSNDFSTLQTGGSALLETGVRLLFDLGPAFRLGAGAAYRRLFGLFDGVTVSLDAGLRFPSAPAGPPPIRQQPESRPQPLEDAGGGLELRDLQIGDIFPVFHKYYDDHAVGAAVLRNGGADPATNITLTLDIKPYMSVPRQCAGPKELAPGESARVELTALFSEKEILEVTEGTKASAEIGWEYAVKGRKVTGKAVRTVRLLNRNAMTWEDDRRAAAFITSLDPSVLTFAKNVSGTVKSVTYGAVQPNFLSAIAFYQALCLYGMSYAVDPKQPSFADRAARGLSEVDFLQFPRQTLEYRAGDCDDLTILFCAIFESVGIETAFITVPGHIYMAFSPGVPADEARASFLNPDDLIYQGDRAWVPIEVTMLDGKFLDAWQAGAKQWREANARKLANLYLTREAWKLYEPVGLMGGGFQVPVPPREAVVAAYRKEAERFVNREIYPETVRLQAEIQKNRNSAKPINRLGVLYARFGLTDIAEAQFQAALSREEYGPAIINLGNLAYMRQDLKKAREWYERAAALAPNDPKAMLNLVRVYHDLENYGLAKESYARLKELDRELALRFAYLDLRGEESTRAAERSGVSGVLLWGDE